MYLNEIQRTEPISPYDVWGNLKTGLLILIVIPKRLKMQRELKEHFHESVEKRTVACNTCNTYMYDCTDN